MQSAVHSPYASSVSPGYSHHMPPPPAVTMQQQQQQAKGSSSTPSRAEYGSYSAYPSQHSVSGPPPSSSSVSQSPLQSAASASLPLAASQQQRMRPPAPAYDPRMAAPTQHQTHQQHQQQAQQQYADGAAGHSASLAGSGSVGLSSGVSASMALMANIYEDLVHELVLDTCYGVHKQEKTASFTPRVGYDGGDVDACGQPVKQGKHADVLFKCEICSRSVGSGKFASHLEKCMGKGRNAARGARRKMIDYSENGLSEQAAISRQFSGGSGNNGHSIGRTATPPVSMAPPAVAGGSGGGGQRYSQPPGGSGSSGFYQQQQPPNPPPPVNVMSPPMQYRHGDSDSWMQQQQQQQQHGQIKQPYPHNTSYPPPPVSTSSPHYPLSHPPIDYSSLPALPSPILPTSSAKRRLSPPPVDASPTSKRAAASRGRSSSTAGSSSDWWSETLPPLLPHHVSTGGYPHLLFVSSPAFPLQATAPSPVQVAALLSAICGCVVGGVDEGKMCCNRREGCGSHREEERVEVRRRVERGEMEIRVKRVKPKAARDSGKGK